MKILVSQMTGLKLRLLERIVQARDQTHSVDTLSGQGNEPNDMTVCQAVEDRICRQRDLASRTDLKDEQVMRAVRLLLKIARKSDLPIDFSTGEIFLLTRGVQHRPREETTEKANFAPSRF
jgi:hypothetical protein